MLFQILSCLLVLAITRVVWRRWKYDLHRIPSPPMISFFLETLKVMASTDKGDLTQLNGRWWKALGCPNVMKLYFLGRTTLFVSDMKTAKSVVLPNKNPMPREKLKKDSIILAIGNDLNTNALLTNTGVEPYVKAVRRVYSTAFQSSNLRLALPKMNTVIQKMLDIVEAEREQGPIEFQKLCIKMTLDVIGEVAFGCNLGGLDGSRDIYRHLTDVGRISVDRQANPYTKILNRCFPFCQRIRQQNETVDSLTAEWTKVVDDIMKREDPPHGEKPIWHGLKNLTDPDTGKHVGFNTLRAEVGFAIMGGMNPTGYQLSWLLAVLSNHPEVEVKLLEELKEYGLVGPEAREAVFDDLSELTYLNAFIKEGMRVAFLGIASFFRQVPRDMTILGYRVPKGTLITLPGNRWMNSEAEWGPDPEVLKPERWLTGEDMSEKYYLGFSYGPRDCIGQRLALTEMRLALIAILRRYRLTPTVSYETLLKNSRNVEVFIAVKDGMWFNVTPREEI